MEKKKAMHENMIKLMKGKEEIMEKMMKAMKKGKSMMMSN